MYARLIQGYRAMDPELQAVSASGARNLRLMVSYCSMIQGFLSLEKISMDLCLNFRK